MAKQNFLVVKVIEWAIGSISTQNSLSLSLSLVYWMSLRKPSNSFWVHFWWFEVVIHWEATNATTMVLGLEEISTPWVKSTSIVMAPQYDLSPHYFSPSLMSSLVATSNERTQTEDREISALIDHIHVHWLVTTSREFWVGMTPFSPPKWLFPPSISHSQLLIGQMSPHSHQIPACHISILDCRLTEKTELHPLKKCLEFDCTNWYVEWSAWLTLAKYYDCLCN